MSGDSVAQNKLVIAERRAQVAALYTKKKSQMEIAAELQVDQATISRDLQALHRQWRESGVRNLDAYKMQELMRIDVMERDYWEAWEASKTEKKSSMAEQKATPIGTQRRDQLLKEDRDGNPAFLAGVQWCVEQRCKLLGLYAPAKTEATVTGSLSWQQFVTQALAEPGGSEGNGD